MSRKGDIARAIDEILRPLLEADGAGVTVVDIADDGSTVSLTLTANPGSLSAGTYTGSIVFTSNTPDNIAVPVTLAISGSVNRILISQTGLSFVTVEQGGAPLPQSFGILNTGLGSMKWSAQASTSRAARHRS